MKFNGITIRIKMYEYVFINRKINITMHMLTGNNLSDISSFKPVSLNN